MVPAAHHAADYHPYDLTIVPHSAIATISDYSTMSAAGVTHFFHGQVQPEGHAGSAHHDVCLAQICVM